MNRKAKQVLFAQFWLFLLGAAGAFAQASYRVQSGDSLASVARQCNHSVFDVAIHNHLAPGAALREGQTLTLPPASLTYVQPGESCAELAARLGVDAHGLAQSNRWRACPALRSGQRIRVPGVPAARGSSAVRAPRHPGRVTLVRDATHQSATLQLVDARGRARRGMAQRLAALMRPRQASRRLRVPSPPARLLETLARISDHFGGARIHIVSGFRQAGGSTRDTSQHTQGHALDIRVDGVANTALRDYARTLDRTGVGYYPRSTFVHVDVRDRSTYWVDWSRPGEAPQYQTRGQQAPTDSTSDERAAAGEGGEAAEPAEAEAVESD